MLRLKEELCDLFKLIYFSSWCIVKFVPLCYSCTSQHQDPAEVVYPSAFLILSLWLNDTNASSIFHTLSHQWGELNNIFFVTEFRTWAMVICRADVGFTVCVWKRKEVWFCERSPHVALDKFNRWKIQATDKLDTKKEWLRPVS